MDDISADPKALMSAAGHIDKTGAGEACPLVETEATPRSVLEKGPENQAIVLNVGCGVYAQEKLPPAFRQPAWREVRLDIDREVAPDFVANTTDMHVISDGLVDAVYSSHNIEHLFPHEVPVALAEMVRVLKLQGFAFLMLPDLQEVARHVAAGNLEDPLYISPMGPIAAIDILFGHRASLASGNLFMAHRTGFSGDTIASALVDAGFVTVLVQRDPTAFSLAVLAFRNKPDVERITWAQTHLLPNPSLPAVLYAKSVEP
jgi:hypothetical protein